MARVKREGAAWWAAGLPMARFDVERSAANDFHIVGEDFWERQGRGSGIWRTFNIQAAMRRLSQR